MTSLDPFARSAWSPSAFDSMTEVDQRKLARTAAIDLIKAIRDQRVLRGGGDQHPALRAAAVQQRQSRAHQGHRTRHRRDHGPGFASESDAIQNQLKRNLAGQNGADQPGNLLSAASQTASQPVNNGSDALQAKLASVMLDMLRLDAGVAAQGSRLTLSALRRWSDGQRSIPGRKSVIYFTTGMRLPPELDAPFPS
jgi:hypothetical protein